MGVDTLADEEGRLGALHRHRVSFTGSFEPLERIARIAQIAMGAPMVAISIIDRDSERVLAGCGVEPQRTDRAGSLGALAIGVRHPLIIGDTRADQRSADLGLDRGEVFIGAYLGVPLQTPDGYNIGVLAVMDDKPREFTEQEVAIAINLAHLAMSQLAACQPDGFDFITGALTRHRFQAEVEREFERATRYERPAALVFLDIDGFREVNAALGPQTADEVLKSVANRATESLRTTDSFGRIGGEEFGMLLPETLAYEASQCAERLREEISRLRFRHAGGVISVTASFGIAPFLPAFTSAVQWFAQADVALYGAKQAGRNCVTFAPAPDASSLPLAEEVSEPAADRMH